MPFFRERTVPCLGTEPPCLTPTDSVSSLPSLEYSVSEKLEESVEVNIKPVYRSPIDNFGYPERCCHCIPLRTGVAIICFLSFISALVELTRSEKTILAIFPEKKEGPFIYTKLVHLIVISVYLLSCGVLLIGIITSKYKAINVYVWAALIFNCISIVLILTSLAFQVINTGMTKRTAMITVLSIAWYSHSIKRGTFFYYISVVNSYKYRLLGADLLSRATM